MELKLYRCAHCGNVAFKLVDKGVPLFCCGQKMDELVPNTTDGALEKHVPAVSRDGKEVSVQVGSVIHPMLEEHYIGDEPVLKVSSEAPVTAYELCNLHGFWKGNE